MVFCCFLLLVLIKLNPEISCWDAVLSTWCFLSVWWICQYFFFFSIFKRVAETGLSIQQVIWCEVLSMFYILTKKKKKGWSKSKWSLVSLGVISNLSSSHFHAFMSPALCAEESLTVGWARTALLLGKTFIWSFPTTSVGDLASA